MPIRGVIFDLDGTLIDSRLDFDQMRRDMALPDRQPILEGIDALIDENRKRECRDILRRHEHQGADCATFIPGAENLLRHLMNLGIPTALLTRNSRESTDRVLTRLGLEFSQVLTREDAPPKPDPGGLLHIARTWGFPPNELLFVGDYLFDVRAGAGAGIRTVLYAPDGPPDYAAEADYVIAHLDEFAAVLQSWPLFSLDADERPT